MSTAIDTLACFTFGINGVSEADTGIEAFGSCFNPSSVVFP